MYKVYWEGVCVVRFVSFSPIIFFFCGSDVELVSLGWDSKRYGMIWMISLKALIRS